MKKVLSTLLLLMAFCVPWVTQAQSTEELTVADGTITNSYVPVYGTYCDDFLRTQIIYPADDLADMINGTISQLTFYLYSSASEAWTSSFQVNLSEVAQTSFASPNFLTTSSVGVYSGTLDATGSTMTITFSTPYVYQGGNLLLDIYSLTDGNYKAATFTGQTVNGASITGYNSSEVSLISNTTQRNFMPKTTFTYVPGVVSCVRPSAITIDNLTSNSASFSWTAGGSETSWIATLRDGENSQSFILNTPSYVANGTLTPNTQYSFSVRSICSVGDTSVPRMVGFRTECGMLTLPFFTDFESETAGGANINTYPNFIPCWTRLNDATSANYQGYPYIYNTTSAGYTHSGTKLLYLYSYKGTLTNLSLLRHGCDASVEYRRKSC